MGLTIFESCSIIDPHNERKKIMTNTTPVSTKEITVTKGYYGYFVTTQVPVGGDKAIEFTTMKRSGGNLVTTAQTVTVESANCSSYMMFQNFSMTVINEKLPRVTSKVVADQHHRALLRIDEILAKNALHDAKTEV